MTLAVIKQTVQTYYYFILTLTKGGGVGVPPQVERGFVAKQAGACAEGGSTGGGGAKTSRLVTKQVLKEKNINNSIQEKY